MAWIDVLLMEQPELWDPDACAVEVVVEREGWRGRGERRQGGTDVSCHVSRYITCTQACMYVRVRGREEKIEKRMSLRESKL